MYINDINDAGISDGSKLVLYADDILLYRAVQSQEDYIALQHDADVLDAWSLSKLLKFNPKKCKTMLITCKRSKKTTPCQILLNRSPVETVDCLNILESI